MRNSKLLILGVLAAISAGLLQAHKPISNTGTADESSRAIQIEDPAVSYVVYHEVTPQTPRVWLKLEVEARYSLYVSLGVPVIERLEDYRPALAVIGPGLPEVELPFDTPAEMGGVVFTTDSVTDPSFFHEPFTGTDSWIYVEEYVRLPQTGTYYIVGYHPLDTPGKLWVAPGRKERWGLGDIFKMPGIIRPVREFHEVR